MSDLMELARRRGFFFQANETYGGVAGFYTYGPAGAALKRNVEDAWRDRFVTKEGNMEIDAPTVTPEPVFQASGHLDGFDDMLVECRECGESHRADHIVEDNTDIVDAETYPTERVEDIIAEHDLVCPTCGTPLAGQEVVEFNLMFETSIGPGSGQPGYLRPETAQGMFTEFPRLKEYAREQLPFGVAQIGTGYRNEISPRNALLRAREFTMAELEYFVDPEEDGPNLDPVADVVLPLYPVEEQQSEGETYLERTPREALDDGILNDEWVAYWLAVSKRWFARVGVDMDRFRLRQHLPGELAHYASDCWDAEAEVEGGWVELEGLASRTDYDLSKHAKHADDTFTVFKQYDEPKTVERATVDPDMSVLGPEYGGAAGDIADALETLAARNRAAFEGSAEQSRSRDGDAVSRDDENREKRFSNHSADDVGGDEPRADEVTVEVDDEAYTVPVEATGFSVEEETEAGRHITPHVVEPAFGVGRAVYTVLAHNYDEDEVGGEQRSVLRLPPEVAPTSVGVFPLMDKDGMGETARDIAADLREAGLSVTYDDSGNIGRRYRRQDEVGTPFCVTVDYETVEEADDQYGTVTVRERDTTAQARVPIDDLSTTLTALLAGEQDFSEL